MIKVSDKEKKILEAYEATFTDGAGEIVLEDLRQSYHERCSAHMIESLDHIPPEYRIWYLEGQRDVYLSIVGAMKLSRETLSEGEDYDTGSDRSGPVRRGSRQ